MAIQSAQLTQLLVELHEVNQELTDVAQPVLSGSELNDDQRKHIGQEMRSRLARWEAVNQRITEALREDQEAARP